MVVIPVPLGMEIIVPGRVVKVVVMALVAARVNVVVASVMPVAVSTKAAPRATVRINSETAPGKVSAAAVIAGMRTADVNVNAGKT